MDAPVITDAKSLIKALGGTGEVAAALGEELNTVSNWRIRGLPERAHLRISRLCDAKGIKLPPDFFERQVAA